MPDTPLPDTPLPSPPPPATPLGRALATGRALTVRAEGTVLGDLASELRRTRLLDLAYTLSAQAFVALIPLLLVTTAAFSSDTDDALVARSLIDRFGLVGAASQAIRVLFRTPGAGTGIYWLGLLITLYSAFSLSRRMSRAYTTLWDVAPLPAGQQWKGLVWIAVQIVMIVFATSLRTFGKAHGSVLAVVAILVLLLAWTGSELLVQQLLTGGQVARQRLIVASVLVSVGRLAVGAWSAIYLPASFDRQAQQYGPIGVVFTFFTWILAIVASLLAAVLLTAVFTRRPARDWFRTPEPSPEA